MTDPGTSGCAVRMAFKIVDRLFVTVFGTMGPADHEWWHFVDVVRSRGIDRCSHLVYSDGGHPSAVHLKGLDELVDGRPIRVAVLSPSADLRGSVRAIQWMNRPTVEAFAPSALGDALEHLIVPKERAPFLDAVIRDLLTRIGQPRFVP